MMAIERRKNGDVIRHLFPGNVGALIIRIGFGGGHNTRIIIRNPQNSIGNYVGPYGILNPKPYARAAPSTRFPSRQEPHNIGALITRIGFL